MAKAKYNPLNAFRNDPLAALKKATETTSLEPQRSEKPNEPTLPDNQGIESRQESSAPQSVERISSESFTSQAATKPLAASLNTSRNTVYLYPEDLTKLRQLSGYASSEHGIRANDSMIFRAALSLLEPDVRLLHALRETELLDRRRKSRAQS